MSTELHKLYEHILYIFLLKVYKTLFMGIIFSDSEARQLLA